MNKFIVPLILISFDVMAQSSKSKGINFFTDILGKKGIFVVIFIIFFAAAYRNSVKLFDWIEDQTYGTRDFILAKCELLFFEIKPNHVTYGLLGVAFGIPSIVFAIFLLTGNYIIGGIIAGMISILGWKLPRPIMNFLVAERIKKYEGQMVDGLNLLSNGLRAGLSVQQSIGLVVEELPAPISQEFGEILNQTKIGAPIEEAFDNLATRVPTEDNDMFVSSVNILKETGGNLAEVFDTIADVIRERVRLKQKIATYVAQGKMQGGMIASMPGMMGAYFASTDPNFADNLFGNPLGYVVLAAALGLNIVGAWAMWKVIQIKV